MKTTFISLIALGIAVAMTGPADHAAAEPMVLTDAQMDRVTAGAHVRIVGLDVRPPTHSMYEIWAWEDGELVAIDSVESFLDMKVDTRKIGPVFQTRE